ncbi:hypothetical protein [Nitrospira sp. Nam80]
MPRRLAASAVRACKLWAVKAERIFCRLVQAISRLGGVINRVLRGRALWKRMRGVPGSAGRADSRERSVG